MHQQFTSQNARLSTEEADTINTEEFEIVDQSSELGGLEMNDNITLNMSDEGLLHSFQREQKLP